MPGESVAVALVGDDAGVLALDHHVGGTELQGERTPRIDRFLATAEALGELLTADHAVHPLAALGHRDDVALVHGSSARSDGPRDRRRRHRSRHPSLQSIAPLSRAEPLAHTGRTYRLSACGV